MSDVDLPPARSLTPLIVRALRELSGQGERKAIIETAVRLGAFSDAQRAEPSRASRANASHPSELHHRLSWAMSHARIAGEIESVRRGAWRLVER
jgi:restriction endonuclease Mrr